MSGRRAATDKPTFDRWMDKRGDMEARIPDFPLSSTNPGGRGVYRTLVHGGPLWIFCPCAAQCSGLKNPTTGHRLPSSATSAGGIAGGTRWGDRVAREINRLTTRKIQAITEPGWYLDGEGLYLAVEPSGSKRWVLRYRMPGKRREMGLGSFGVVPLAKARELAAAARSQIQEGIDPIEAKASGKIEPARPVTFSDVAITYMADRETTWRNINHRRQWRTSLEVDGARIWSMPVAAIGTDDVLAVLRPIWFEKTESASRLRGRIERILDAARVGGHRSGENPARWRGHLDVLLPTYKRSQRGHWKAMPYAEVPAFYARIAAGKQSYSAWALRFTILTAARSGETRGMTWGEVDLNAALWIVPADRMKGHRTHRVPLTVEAIAVLALARPEKLRADDLVFRGRHGSVLADTSLAMFLRRQNDQGLTVHGFRSSFRDWVTEETDFAGDLAEAALAHLTGDETERAYRRGDALEKRRHLMDAWAAFVAGDGTAASSTR